MLEQFAEGVDLFALAGALELQVHEDVLKNLVLLVEHVNLVADGALVLAIGDIFAGNLRKIAKALLATELVTAAALE